MTPFLNKLHSFTVFKKLAVKYWNDIQEIATMTQALRLNEITSTQSTTEHNELQSTTESPINAVASNDDENEMRYPPKS